MVVQHLYIMNDDYSVVYEQPSDILSYTEFLIMRAGPNMVLHHKTSDSITRKPIMIYSTCKNDWEEIPDNSN